MRVLLSLALAPTRAAGTNASAQGQQRQQQGDQFEQRRRGQAAALRRGQVGQAVLIRLAQSFLVDNLSQMIELGWV